MTILIVDDSFAASTVIKSQLQKAGYNDIITADSAYEAFKILKKDATDNCLTNKEDTEECPDIDLILMDIDMPGMSGIEACRLIKSTERLRDIPVIIITARSDMSSFKLAFSAGALDYITKMARPHELLPRVHSALRLKHEMDMRKAREKRIGRSEQIIESGKRKNRIPHSLISCRQKSPRISETKAKPFRNRLRT